jgi:hypothetical protein
MTFHNSSACFNCFWCFSSSIAVRAERDDFLDTTQHPHIADLVTRTGYDDQDYYCMGKVQA